MFEVHCYIKLRDDGHDKSRRREAVRAAGVPCDAYKESKGHQILSWRVETLRLAVIMRKNIVKAGYSAYCHEEISGNILVEEEELDCD